MKIFKYLKVFFKIFFFVISTIINEVFVLFLLIFTIPLGYRRRTGAFVSSLWAWTCVKLMGIKIKKIGRREKQKHGVLFISNHSSYTDILILSSCFFLNFVSKAEVKKWPVIGFLAICGGTIFVEREKKTNAKKYVDEIQKSIKKGSNILIFPEGTSSRGDNILPFYSSLFQAPLELKIKIQPVYIDYYKFNGKRIKDNPDLKDQISWYGDMSLAPHALNLLKAKSLEVRIFLGELIDTANFENTSSGRKDLTQKAFLSLSELKNMADNI